MKKFFKLQLKNNSLTSFGKCEITKGMPLTEAATSYFLSVWLLLSRFPWPPIQGNDSVFSEFWQALIEELLLLRDWECEPTSVCADICDVPLLSEPSIDCLSNVCFILIRSNDLWLVVCIGMLILGPAGSNYPIMIFPDIQVQGCNKLKVRKQIFANTIIDWLISKFHSELPPWHNKNIARIWGRFQDSSGHIWTL